MANESTFHLITAIGNSDREGHVAHLLHTQKWSILYRALDGDLLTSFLQVGNLKPQSILIFSRDLPRWQEESIESAEKLGVVSICIDDCEFTSYLIMEHIRQSLRNRNTREDSRSEYNQHSEKDSLPEYTDHREGAARSSRELTLGSFGDREISNKEEVLHSSQRSFSTAHIASQIPKSARDRFAKSHPIYLFTGGSGSPGISTLAVSSALSISVHEKVSLIELEEEYPSHHFLTSYKQRNHRENSRPRVHEPNIFIKHQNKTSNHPNEGLTSKWRVSDSKERRDPRRLRSDNFRNSSGFSIKPFDFNNHLEFLSELREESTSIIDMGRMPRIDNMMSDRRRQGIVVHDLLSIATAVIYCLKVEPLQVDQLNRFLSEVNNHQYKWNLVFAFTMVNKSKRSKLLLSELTQMVRGYDFIICDYDSRIGDYFPAKAAIGGGYGKQVSQLIEVIR